MFLCVSCVCTLLYTGSSVLQINESPVCSLEKVPQVLACDWLLACLQVTFKFYASSTNQQAARCSWFCWSNRAQFVFPVRNVFVFFLRSFQIICGWWCFGFFWSAFLCVQWSNSLSFHTFIFIFVINLIFQTFLILHWLFTCRLWTLVSNYTHNLGLGDTNQKLEYMIYVLKLFLLKTTTKTCWKNTRKLK